MFGVEVAGDNEIREYDVRRIDCEKFNGSILEIVKESRAVEGETTQEEEGDFDQEIGEDSLRKRPRG